MAANPGIKIINDHSAQEAVAKLRAMNEVGKVTWDLVDALTSDAARLCDEGLAIPIDVDKVLGAGAGSSTPGVGGFRSTCSSPSASSRRSSIRPPSAIERT